MQAIQTLLSPAWVDRVAWALVHFLWQGALIAALYAAVRRWGMHGAGPNPRYVLGCCALIAMIGAPLLTVIWLQPATPIATVSRSNSVDAAAISFVTAASGPAPSGLYATTGGRLLQWIVVAWLAGAMAFGIRMIGGWVVAAGMRKTEIRPVPAEWQQTLRRLASRIELSRPAMLLVSALVEAPVVIGWIRPVVLMPIGALTGLPQDQVEGLLLHELAHIRRHDYLINMLQGVGESLLFYHPAVWWVSGQIRVEREMCCDDIAVEAGGDVLAYARALAELESLRASRMRVFAGGAVGADGGSLVDRIARLLNQSDAPARVPFRPGSLLSATVIATLILTVVVGLFSSFSLEAQSIHSLQAQENFNQGLRALKEARYEDAAASFQEALSLEPGFADAELNLGRAFEARFIPGSEDATIHQFGEKAAETFHDVLKKDPGNIAALAQLAFIYQALNDYRAARDTYLRAAQLQPLNPIPFYSIGSVDWIIVYNKKAPPPLEEKASLIEEGLRNLDIALTMNPEYDEAMTFKNLLLREKAQITADPAEKNYLTADADQWFNRALETRKTNMLKPKAAAGGAISWGPPPAPPAPPPPPSRTSPR